MTEVKKFELMVSIYACTPYHPDFVNNYRTVNLEFMIEIELFWNVVFIARDYYRLRIKKEKKTAKREKTIQKKLDAAEKEEHSTYNNIAETDRLAELRAELEEIREGKLRGSLIRSRAQHVDFNEKPSKFFLNS